MAAEWYYSENDQQRGPVSFAELQRRAQSGQLVPSDLVWTEGMPEWAPASRQTGIFGGPALDAAEEEIPEAIPATRPASTARRPPLSTDWPRAGQTRKIPLIGCVAIMGFFMLCCGALAMIGWIAGPPEANQPPNQEWHWALLPGRDQFWPIHLEKDARVQIKVTSDFDTDMDLFVFENKAKLESFRAAKETAKAMHLCLAFDDRPSKDCRVDFTAPASQEYWILLKNRAFPNTPKRNRANTGKIVVQSRDNQDAP